jgi:hypothetical protein
MALNSETFDLSGQDVKAASITVESGGAVTRTGRKLIVPALNGKVGATAGWVITAGTNISHATLPASQTGSTLVIPISGLAVGDTVTAVAIVGQVESAGATASGTLDVRKLTADAAAALTDASLSTDALGNTTADALLTDTNGTWKVSGLTEVLAESEQLYALITATTAAATDIDISHLVVTVNQA